MMNDLIKNSFNVLFEQLPTPVMRERMLQFEKKQHKKKIYLIPAIITIFLFIGTGLFLLQEMSFQSHNSETFFQMKNDQYYLYDITIFDLKSQVIEKLGENYIEDNTPEVYGEKLKDASILTYKDLNLTFQLSEGRVVSITMNYVDKDALEALLNSYSGDKFINEDGTTHLYVKDTLQMLTIKYDANQNLWLSLHLASPEFIQNLENGIYE